MKRLFLNLAVIFAVLTIACSSGTSKELAKVDGQKIPFDEFKIALRLELEKYDTSTILPDEKFARIKEGLLEEMVRDRIIGLEAKRLGISISTEELNDHLLRHKSKYSEAAFRKMLQIKGVGYDQWQNDRERELLAEKVIDREVVAKIEISEREIERYYKTHKREFTHQDEVRARQIVTDDPKSAEDLWKKAKAGENFAALAQQFSIAPEAKRGGDLGWFERGVMPKIFDEACFPLPMNEVSPIIKTEFGYHIFKVVDRRPAASRPLASVKDIIVNKLRQEKMADAYIKWYEPLRKKAKVELDKKVFEELTQTEFSHPKTDATENNK